MTTTKTNFYQESRALLQSVLTDFPQFDTDEPIEGSAAVEWLCNFHTKAKALLSEPDLDKQDLSKIESWRVVLAWRNNGSLRTGNEIPIQATSSKKAVELALEQHPCPADADEKSGFVWMVYRAD